MAAGNSSMAGTDSTGLGPWRELFRGRDIYDVIGKAVLVAATDSPQEFRRRRDGIVEQIYTAPAAIVPTLQGRSAGEVSGGTALQVSDKGSKVASCTVVAPPEEPEDKNHEEGMADQNGNGHGDNANASSELEMDWLQTLADEVDEETQEIDEVLRIKEILLNHHEQSASILFDSLRRLQLMQLTADKIKSTEIGDAVAALSKHKLHKIRTLVREIIKGWKAVLDEWIAATKATEDGDPNKSLDISNPLAAEDEGLAIPPMDVGALFLVSHATAMQNVSEFLQGMDDDGIVTNVGMDKGGNYGSNSKHYGAKPSNTVPRSKDPIIVQTLPVTQGSPLDKRNPQKLPARQGTPSKNTNPPQKLLDAAGNSLMRQQGCYNEMFNYIVEALLTVYSMLTWLKKMGVPTESSVGSKVGTEKKKAQLTYMNLDETKRKLRGAYQEAENGESLLTYNRSCYCL
ncbi:probable mediator of RNA polymerase II transcription subunit 26b [Setaria italica]|uniref:probable mediator of RNA polymerase II transcription subunit 26b n=1 Tax=Setaria italica TaxID=4555 RepID=UPI000350D2F8|nr:probable mediator of RNA polymerase II transcription subunit 26b [Setaria italica]